MNSLDKSIWRCRYLCRRTILRIFKALIMPVLLYGSETWTLSCALESHLDAFCNRSLRRIMGYCWRDHVSNQRLHPATGTGPVTRTIRDLQLRFYGHLTCVPQDDPAHLFLFRTALCGEGLWDGLGSRGLDRSRWAESLPGG
ncbi:uncharacterized protein [Penaeus vannamei]|uniref:uncharacterized protein n=1 Tax=Penaeus vannamei TaxID=6689 RepID=UPI00387F97F0